MSDLISCVIPLSKPLPPVLGVGAYLKNALCLIQGNEAWISRENGSLDSVEAITRFQTTAQAMIDTAKEKPILIAHDWHPDFPCTRWAMESGYITVGIQHHHAHAAAVMAEHGIDHPVLALTLDGFGLGKNNEAWGGELLRVDTKGFQRLGHLRTLSQPGGDVAARQPWRMGAAALFAMGRGDEIATRYAAFEGASHLAMMMQRGLNAPPTSSAGRLFDAACGLLNVMPVATFEGEAPMKLESMVTKPQVMAEGWQIEDDVLDMRPLLARLVECEAGEGANLFHGTLAAGLLEWPQKASVQTGIKQVALCGGCFFNKVLRESLSQGMMAAGLTPLLPKQMLVGDTAIALGQAYAAALKTGE
ncbi:MAG TPA: hydrogenase maturation protein HypF [Rhodospirillaceae bacterium]|nr:hydrogenase maturation protein HypF [Rhodospirillaceae bacterium]